METGNSTAGNSYKQDWEHIAKFFVVETSVNWKIHCWVSNKKTNCSGSNHKDKHEGGHKISRLHQKPHWKNSSKEDICECNIVPSFSCSNNWEADTKYKAGNHAYQSKNNLFPTSKLHLFLNQTKDNSEGDKHNGNTSGSTVNCRLCDLTCGSISDKTIKSARNHICECSSNNKGK